jgi:hypothetical protein
MRTHTAPRPAHPEPTTAIFIVSKRGRREYEQGRKLVGGKGTHSSIATAQINTPWIDSRCDSVPRTVT